MFWDLTVIAVNLIENMMINILLYIRSLLIGIIPQCMKPSDNTFLSAAMCITKFWALIGLYSTKLFEMFFCLLLRLPDDKFAMFSNIRFLNTAGDTINILSALDDKNTNITNKLKLFIKFYLERGGKYEVNATNGFDFEKFEKLFNSSMLYCYYMIETQMVDRFWDNLFKFVIHRVDQLIVKKDENGEHNLSLRNVDFDTEVKEESFEDLARLIESFD